MTRKQVGPRSCDHGRCKNDSFTLSTALLTKQHFVNVVDLIDCDVFGSKQQGSNCIK